MNSTSFNNNNKKDLLIHILYHTIENQLENNVSLFEKCAGNFA